MVEQKQPLLSIVPPLGVCREGYGPACPTKCFASLLGVFVTLHPGVQQRTSALEVPEDAWEAVGWDWWGVVPHP